MHEWDIPKLIEEAASDSILSPVADIAWVAHMHDYNLAALDAHNWVFMFSSPVWVHLKSAQDRTGSNKTL